MKDKNASGSKKEAKKLLMMDNSCVPGSKIELTNLNSKNRSRAGSGNRSGSRNGEKAAKKQSKSKSKGPTNLPKGPTRKEKEGSIGSKAPLVKN